jgi:predicted nucleotide-binding protein (sugar kinase/HSP70/actin superfamily)
MLKVLERYGVKPQNAAFFMPGTSGPCRFGMYHCMQKLVLKYAGIDGAVIFAPNQDSSFYSHFARNFNGTGSVTFMKDIWASIAGIDLLHKLILRLRPFAVDTNQAQQVYENCVRLWVEEMERTTEGRRRMADRVRLFEKFADDFGKIELNSKAKKPRIGIVGEIYVRNHPFANLNIISRLESLGAACDLASLAEWIYYTNFTRSKMAQRRGQWKNLLNNAVHNFFQHKIERELAKPLEKKFGRLAEQPTNHIIDLAKPYVDASFEGEAILSIGKMVEYHHDGFGGVVNVMPFTCMPSTIVSTQTRRLSADCNEMPILNLSFDGQEDVTLTTRLEAFVEQVAARGKVTASELAVM